MANRVLSDYEFVQGGDELADKYHMGKDLGNGGFGSAYECINKQTGEKFAFKCLQKANLSSVLALRNEVMVMKKLPPHPNIVQLKDVFEDEYMVYIIMELCEGGELAERMKMEGLFREEYARDVMHDIIKAIIFCHEHGVLHRDLKTRNILFANSNADSPVKLIDFGLSTFHRESEVGMRHKDVVGSIPYIAPEVIDGNHGPKADVWSCGVILYMLLTNRQPFTGYSYSGLRKSIAANKIKLQSSPWKAISSDAKSLVRTMLDTTEFERPSAAGLLNHPWFKKVQK